MLRNLNRKILLAAFIVAVFSGCETTHIEKVEYNELDSQVSYKMLYIHLNDSTIIEVADKNPRYKKSYKGVKNVIVYELNNKVERYVKVENISKIIIQKSISNVPLTILAILGTLGGILVVLFIIALSGASWH